MVNNLKQLRERHCTSIIRLIKQDALKKKRNILSVSYNKNKVNFYLQVSKSKIFVGISIEIKKRIGIVISLIFMLLFNLIPT